MRSTRAFLESFGSRQGRRWAVLLACAILAPACGGGGGGGPLPPVYGISTTSLPAGTVGTAYSQTLQVNAGTAPFSWALLSGAPPVGLTLSAAGVISGTPSGSASSTSFTVRVTDANGITDDQALTIVVSGGTLATLAVNTPGLTGATQNFPYSVGLSAFGGLPPYTWSITSGALPAGLSLDPSTGLISGTPTTVGGPVSFTVTVNDSASSTPASQPLSITVSAPMVITTTSPLPQGTVGAAYSQGMALTGGSGGYTWSIYSGITPPGLTMAPGTGVLSGTPTVAGVYGIRVRVVDNASSDAFQVFSVTINPAPAVTTLALVPWTQNNPGYNQTLTAVGGTGALTWSVTSGALPTGLTLAPATGAITGTPTVAGTFNFTVTATDTVGGSGFKALSIVVNPAVTVSPATLPGWTINRTGYTQTVTSSGGTGARVLSRTGTIPTGMTFSTATGVLSGTPTAAGTFNFTVTATDSLGATGSQAYSVVIAPVPTISTTTLPNWTINRAYNQTLLTTAATGTAPFSWAITAGLQPAGLSLSTGGVLSGTPTATGPSTFTVTVTDAAGATATQQYVNLTINAAPTIATTTLPNWTINRPYSQTLLPTAATGTAPFGWAITAGPQPTGMTLSAGGVLSGTPTATGPFTFTVTLTDAAGATATQQYSNVTINPTPAIATTTLPNWTVNRPGYSQTLLPTAATGTAPFGWAITAGPQPTGMTLSAGGVLSGTPTAAGPFTFTVTLTDAAGATATQQYSNVTINPVPTIATTTLPDWTQSFAYNQALQVTASTGTAPFSWAVTGGAEPPGLTLSTAGALTGTPTTVGQTTFTVTVTDAAGATAAQQYVNLTISASMVVTNADPLAPWTKDFAGYSQTLASTGGTGTKTWSIASGLPTGITLNTGTGALTGQPSATAGDYVFTAVVTDSVGATASKQLTIHINDSLTVTTGTPMQAWTEAKSGYNQTLAATGGTGGLTWTMTGGSYPTGLAALTSGGVIAGTPTVAGTYAFTVQVADAIGATASKSMTIVVNNPLSITTTTPMASWTQDRPGYNQTLAASGGTGAQNWVVLSGFYPTGMDALTSGGVIAGTPNGVGTYNFTVQVTDSVGATASKPVAITMNPAPAIATTTLPNWTVNQFYNQTLLRTAGTGTAPFSWTITAGAQPTGLTLSTNGVLSGTPTVAAQFTFTVTLTDAAGATATQQFSNVTINPSPGIATAGLPNWTINRPYSQTLLTTVGTGTAPFTWQITGGSQPTGLSLSTGGVLSGTPTASGPFSFNVTVTDAANATANQGYFVTINQAPAITTPLTLPDGLQSVLYNQQFQVSGGTGPFTWTSNPDPPITGFTFSTGGLLNGTTGTGGNNNFTITVTDDTGASANGAFSLFILSSLTITTATTLPNATASAAYTAPDLAASGGRTPYSFSLLSGTLPGTITFSTAGVWSGTAPASNGTNNFVVRVTDADGRTADKSLSITTTGGAGALTIVTVTLPAGTQGGSYSAGLTGSGGVPAGYSWSVTAGSLPTGLTLSTAGVISGTPTTTVGSPFGFTVTLDDTVTNVNQALSITINPQLLVTTGNPMPGWTVGGPSSYSQTLTSSGGTGTKTWAILAGSLPTGMTLNTGTGAVTGVPSATGMFNFTAQVSDQGGATASASLSITVNPAPELFNTGMPQGTQGAPYPFAEFFVGGGTGTGPFTFQVTNGSLPNGMGLTNSQVTGTPTESGTFNFTVTVTDGAGATGFQLASITINGPLSITTGATLPQGTETVAYNQALSTSGGTGAVTWSMTGGTLPTGMNFTAGGVFTGTPAAATSGTYNPQIQATDSVGGTATKTFTLVIDTDPLVQSAVPATTSPTVNTDVNLVLTFNMAMVKADVESRFSLAPLSGSPVHLYFWDTPGADPNGTVLTVVFDTVAPFGVISGDDLLADNTVYTWTIADGALSQSGLPMAVQTGQFKTVLDSTGPTITSIRSNPSTENQDPQTTILTGSVTRLRVTFNEAMNQSNAEVRLSGGADQREARIGTPDPNMFLTWVNATTLDIVLETSASVPVPLAANSGYELEIWSLNDANGNWWESESNFILVTQGNKTNPPFVTAHFPVADSTGVNRDASIFITTSELLSPDVRTRVTIGGAPTPYIVRYDVGDGPRGVQIVPTQAWPANTAITVTIPGGAGGVTNASLVPLAANFSFTFTTGATGAGTNPIVIDDALSSLKNGTIDNNAFGGMSGSLRFKDSVTGVRVYLNQSTLVNSAISVTGPNGIPVKRFRVNPFGEDDMGDRLDIARRWSQGATNLALGTVYTIALKGSITGSAGQTFAPVNYTFTTVPNFNTRERPQINYIDSRGTTQEGPVRKVDLALSFGGGMGSSISAVAAAAAGNTDYTVTGFLPAWVTAGTIVQVAGCTQVANNGVFTVVSITGFSPPFTLRLANAGGVLENPVNGGQVLPPWAVSAEDVTGSGNVFLQPLTYNEFQFGYESTGNEAGLVTAGDHTFRFHVVDGIVGHEFSIDEKLFFYSGADMSALTLGDITPAANPTYTWSGTVPASVTAVFLAVSLANSAEPLFTWVMPPGATSFDQPANFPLAPGNYQWTLGFFHSMDGTLRGGGGEGEMSPKLFTVP